MKTQIETGKVVETGKERDNAYPKYASKVTAISLQICHIGGGVSLFTIVISVYVLFTKKATTGVALSSAAVGAILFLISMVVHNTIDNRGYKNV